MGIDIASPEEGAGLGNVRQQRAVGGGEEGGCDGWVEVRAACGPNFMPNGDGLPYGPGCLAETVGGGGETVGGGGETVGGGGVRRQTLLHIA